MHLADSRRPRRRLHSSQTRSRRTWVHWACVAAITLSAHASSSYADEVDVVIERARSLRSTGDLPGALALLRPMADDPKTSADPRVGSALGDALLAGANPSEAVTAYRSVVRVRPEPDDRRRLAIALIETAKAQMASGSRLSLRVVPYLEDALAEVKAAAAGAPAAGREFAVVAAEAHWLLGNPAAAREALEAPGLERDALAEDLFARACYALADYAAAADAWGRAGNPDAQAAAWSAGKDPRAIRWYADLALTRWNDPVIGDLAIRGGAYVDGGEGLDGALAAAVAPPDVSAEKRSAIERLRGRLAERRGKYADAVARYRVVAVARPDEWESGRDLARALFSLSVGDPAMRDEAIELYRNVLTTHPDDPDARVGLGWQARLDATNASREWPEHRRLDRAVELFRSLAETAPDDGQAWSQYGNAARIAGANEASIVAYDRAVAIQEYDAATWNDRGLALLAAGRRDEAIASFDRAIAVDAGDTSSRQNAARQQRLAGHDDVADAHLAAALRTARAVGGPCSLYRSLMDRGFRARRHPGVR